MSRTRDLKIVLTVANCNLQLIPTFFCFQYRSVYTVLPLTFPHTRNGVNRSLMPYCRASDVSQSFVDTFIIKASISGSVLSLLLEATLLIGLLRYNVRFCITSVKGLVIQ